MEYIRFEQVGCRTGVELSSLEGVYMFPYRNYFLIHVYKSINSMGTTQTGIKTQSSTPALMKLV